MGLVPIMSKYWTRKVLADPQNIRDVAEKDFIQRANRAGRASSRQRLIGHAEVPRPHRHVPERRPVETIQVERVGQREYHRRRVASNRYVRRPGKGAGSSSRPRGGRACERSSGPAFRPQSSWTRSEVSAPPMRPVSTTACIERGQVVERRKKSPDPPGAASLVQVWIWRWRVFGRRRPS